MKSSSLLCLSFLIILSSLVCPCCEGYSIAAADVRVSGDPLKSIFGAADLGPLGKANTSDAQAPGTGAPRTLVLARNRTRRPDILRRFKRYQGGWDVRNKHYWASIGFTGAPGFILAVLWFVSFGMALVVHHCCGCRISIEGKRYEHARQICLILLVVCTCISMTGSILLSVGQNEFYSEALHTVSYVVNQSDYTVQMLRNVTEYLSLAKSINLSRVILPSDIQEDIDELKVDLTSTAQTLTVKTSDNAAIIRRVFNIVRASLIVVAAVMLLVALVGLVLSLLGYQNPIHLFIFSGWFLVFATFILCGVFVIIDNAVLDSCTAMQEWANNPQAETALSDILPCVDERYTNQTLNESKKVVAGIANVVNQFIYTYADTNRSRGDMFYYNQSGPLMPPLCFPYDNQLQDHDCGPQEVSMENASVVWEKYICKPSKHHDICRTVGRLTPSMYSQLVVAVNASYAIKHYTPPMLSLENCDFVRNAFTNITSSYCPLLEHYLGLVVAGLALISVGVMLCLILWILNANRPQREEVFVKFSSTVVCKSRDGDASPLSLVPSPKITFEK
ncbi:hypothetical protein Droror1_Dr00022463 [Drosera rotundifolia]